MTKYAFAEVLLPLNIDKTFTYKLPEINQEADILPGQRVIVNVGRNKKYTGIIFSLHNNNPEYPTKTIIEILDKTPILTENQIKLIFWIHDYYCCSLGDVLSASVPSALLPSDESTVYLNDDADSTIELNNIECVLIEELKKKQKLNIKDITSLLKIKNPYKIIDNLHEKKLIHLEREIISDYKPKLQAFISFEIKDLDENKLKSLKSKKQSDVISYLCELSIAENKSKIEIPANEIQNSCSVPISVLKSLNDKGFITIERKQVSRFENNYSNNNQKNLKELILSESQEHIYRSIIENFAEQKPVLLHGVTSSGKTEIYIKLIEKAISEGKQVLYLLPEISITTQIIHRLSSCFGSNVAVYHSRHSLGLRTDIYTDLLKRKISIILGVRSSVFLPFTDLGLIIVDEEHDASYKQQDPDPRYNARDIALILGKLHNANVILGSATPSIESYYNAKKGKYALLELNQRYGEVLMPEIIISDLKDAYHRKLMKGHLHPELFKNINKSLEQGKQVILFQNRRGYSPYLECYDCGYVPICKNCNVNLTFHKIKNKLVCHYCGSVYEVPQKCPKCSSSKIKTRGFGTEKIEQEVETFFPKAKIERLDYDTASTKHKYENIINDFKYGKINILVGTQMIGKGLDFENVNLVGVLNADNLLNFPDFRAFERAYQLLAQVSGRSGRRTEQGKVIIQTYSPNHKVLQWLVKNSYKDMFYSELNERKQFKYPPIWSFVNIKIKHKEKSKSYLATKLLYESLKEYLKDNILGPYEPIINKISNYYYHNLLIKFQKNKNSKEIKNLIRKKINYLITETEFKGIKYEIDVDPY